MIANTYITFVPKEFGAYSNKRYNLIARDIADIDKKAIFKNCVPPKVIPDVIEELRRKGFVDSLPFTP